MMTQHHPIDRSTFGGRLRDLRERAGRSAAELSIAAGLSKNSVAGMESDHDRSPRLEAVQGLARALGVSLSYLAEGRIDAGPAGFAESEAQPWDPPPRDGQRPDRADAARRLAATLAPSARSPATYRLTQSHAALGFLAGDVLVIDLKASPQPRDRVLATVADLQTGAAVTLLRMYASPYLIDPDPASADQLLIVDGQRTVVMGVVVASFRAPQLNAST